MKRYDKLVRDRIPQIIRDGGRDCRTRTLSQEEYVARLHDKLREELDEYLASGEMEELADLCEVIRVVAAARGSSMEEIEALRARKAQQRGGFDGRILLIDVTD